MAQKEKIKREVTERKKILLNYGRVLCLHFPGSHGNRRKGRLYRQFEVVKKNKGVGKGKGGIKHLVLQNGDFLRMVLEVSLIAASLLQEGNRIL